MANGMDGRPGEKFRCDACGGTFERERSDEEAVAEMVETWQPHEGDDDLAIICDPCFRGIVARASAEAPEVFRRAPR